MGNVVATNIPNTPLLDKQGGLTLAWRQFFLALAKTVNEGFDPDGNYQGPIGPEATIDGRHTLATIVQHLTDAGVIEPEGLIAATDAAQGAVKLAPGSVGNTLGSAAMKDASAFDPAGSAAAAEAHADAAAATAQANAEAFAKDASNITSGVLDAARLPGLTTVIATAPLTALGTPGSMSFQNGLLVAQTPAT